MLEKLHFSPEAEPKLGCEIIILREGNLDEIVDFEQKVFISELQASRETISERLAKGHTILGLFYNGELIGKISFSDGVFSPDDYKIFPKTFEEYSGQDKIKNPNAVFVYDLGVLPDYRGGAYTGMLVKAVIDIAKQKGIKFVVGEGRLATYNGSPVEKVEAIPEVKSAIDNFLQGGNFPSDKILIKDKLLFYYKIMAGMEFLWIIPNFEKDTASGDFRVIGYLDINAPQASLSEEWAAISEAMYGREFIKELDHLFKKNNVKRILECGCGDGHVLRMLAEKGYAGIGFDNSQEMIEMAKKKNFHTNLQFKTMNMLDLANINQQFDAILCRGNTLSVVISGEMGTRKFDFEKINNLLSKIISLMAEKLKSGGVLYLDAISEAEANGTERQVHIKSPKVGITGCVKNDRLKKVRYTFGGGTVHGKNFNGDSIGYLLTIDDLEALLEQFGFSKIWRPKLEHEINYEIICATK